MQLECILATRLCHDRAMCLKLSSNNLYGMPISLALAWHSSTAYKHFFVYNLNLNLKNHNIKFITLLGNLYSTKLLEKTLTCLPQNFKVKFEHMRPMDTKTCTLLNFSFKSTFLPFFCLNSILLTFNLISSPWIETRLNFRSFESCLR